MWTFCIACFIFKRTAGNPFICRISVNRTINEIEDRRVSGLLIELCSSLCPFVCLSGYSQTPMVQF